MRPRGAGRGRRVRYGHSCGWVPSLRLLVLRLWRLFRLLRCPGVLRCCAWGVTWLYAAGARRMAAVAAGVAWEASAGQRRPLRG